ncbi:Forkhead-associated (FHA) domain-containing protein [Cynara cardunculus var. scolymus]|uniref:protein-serine/threonine phosphatase n=1 Tax=Cynara cardunculus var. scolymus TaxID=59895 RepID=A0A118K6V1_CYNCS|nr:Forkhead-associated (FHA) domain-containing protein [Cynara cardunculus var. scolymus]
MAKLPTVAVVDGIVTADGGLLPYLVLLLLLMLLLILIIILIACKPWRVFSRNYRSRTVKATTSSDVLDVERPLVSQDSDIVQSNITEHATNFASEDSCHQNDGHQNSSRTHGLSYKHKLPPTPSHFSHDGSLILDISDEDVVVGQTLKRPSLANDSVGEQKYSTKEDLSYKSGIRLENDSSKQFMSRSTADQRSILTLKVISGPSSGAHYSIQSTNKSKLPLTLGRVSPSDVLVTDSEVSGKHAMINWNLNKLKWELVDMGSLNGTLLNSKTVHHPQTGSRHWGDPVELTSGDIITVGTTSKISFGLFGICDGHGGAAAASFASKIMPEMVTRILSDTFRREKVFSHCDASDVLREAFSQTEAHMDHLYEGCTATVLLIWADGHDNYFAQCANVGDSACIAIVEGQQVKITEDHRIASYTERLRMQAAGEPLKDGEKRLCGLNLARMLGDKYLKQQDARFSSEPYISQVVYMNDGFWDVVNPKKAIQLVHQIRERNCDDASAENIAKLLLSEARAQRTKDNTSIIFLDFDTNHHHDMMMDHEA